jgi:hypothetical protein
MDDRGRAPIMQDNPGVGDGRFQDRLPLLATDVSEPRKDVFVSGSGRLRKVLEVVRNRLEGREHPAVVAARAEEEPSAGQLTKDLVKAKQSGCPFAGRDAFGQLRFLASLRRERRQGVAHTGLDSIEGDTGTAVLEDKAVAVRWSEDNVSLQG